MRQETMQVNPSLLNAITDTYGKEVYTILHHAEIFYFKRMEAIKKTIEVAVAKHTEITIMLNETPFCKVKPNGKYIYIYDPKKDEQSSPWLKQYFIDKGIAIN